MGQSKCCSLCIAKYHGAVLFNTHRHHTAPFLSHKSWASYMYNRYSYMYTNRCLLGFLITSWSPAVNFPAVRSHAKGGPYNHEGVPKSREYGDPRMHIFTGSAYFHDTVPLRTFQVHAREAAATLHATRAVTSVYSLLAIHS